MRNLPKKIKDLKNNKQEIKNITTYCTNNKNCKYTGIKTDTDRLINDFRIKLLPLIRQYKEYKSERTIKEIQVMAENYRQSYKKILDSIEYNEYIKCIIIFNWHNLVKIYKHHFLFHILQ